MMDLEVRMGATWSGAHAGLSGEHGSSLLESGLVAGGAGVQHLRLLPVATFGHQESGGLRQAHEVHQQVEPDVAESREVGGPHVRHGRGCPEGILSGLGDVLGGCGDRFGVHKDRHVGLDPLVGRKVVPEERGQHIVEPLDAAL